MSIQTNAADIVTVSVMGQVANPSLSGLPAEPYRLDADGKACEPIGFGFVEIAAAYRLPALMPMEQFIGLPSPKFIGGCNRLLIKFLKAGFI